MYVCIYIHTIQRVQYFFVAAKAPKPLRTQVHSRTDAAYRPSPAAPAQPREESWRAKRGRGGDQNRVKVPKKWLNKWGTPGNDRENAMEAAFWKQVSIFLGLVLYKTNTLESQCTRNGDIPLQMQTNLLLLEPSPVLNAKSWFNSDNHARMKPSKKWEMMVYLWRSTWKMMGYLSQ